jgi:hypothetical protein
MFQMLFCSDIATPLQRNQTKTTTMTMIIMMTMMMMMMTRMAAAKSNKTTLPVLSDFVKRRRCAALRRAFERSRSIKVSLLASRVNEGLSRETSLLTVGMALAGAVRSIEDRGYDIDLGLERRALSCIFASQCATCREYRVGEPLLVFVSEVPSSVARRCS